LLLSQGREGLCPEGEEHGRHGERVTFLQGDLSAIALIALTQSLTDVTSAADLTIRVD
jgi:hypothetical protein